MSTTPQPKVRKHRDLGELQALLLRACPPCEENQRVSIPVLAGHLGITASYIYRWIETNTVPAAFAQRIVKVSAGRVELSDFYPYVFSLDG